MKLEITKGKQKGAVFDLEGESASIGRSSECEIQVLDKYASRTHAFLRKDTPLFWTIQDLSSKQGIFVNDEKVASWPLEGGDAVRIGRTELLVIGDKRPPGKESSTGKREERIRERNLKLSDPQEWKGDIGEEAVVRIDPANRVYRPAPADAPLPMPDPDSSPDNAANLEALAARAAEAKTRCGELLAEGQNALEAVWNKLEKVIAELAARERDLAERERELRERLADVEKNGVGPSKAEQRLQQLKALLAEEETADSSVPESKDEEGAGDGKDNYLMFGDLDSKESDEA